MYIKELRIDGYGAHRNLTVELASGSGGESPVTIVCGPNESGKSTMLRFVRAMLYGFPSRKDPVERGEPVFGGRHGGGLLFADRSGAEWRIERLAERGRELRIRDSAGAERTISQAEWEKRMLGGVSDRTFRRLFSVSLDELRELRSLQGEELGEFLYHAGPAGGSAVAEARRKLGAEKDRLYRPKGTTQEIYTALEQLKEVEAAIRRSRDDVVHYRETASEYERVGGLLARAEAELPELRRRSAELQGAYELREWWLQRERLLAEESELAALLPDPEAPPLGEEDAIAWAEEKSSREKWTAELAELREEERELRLLRERLAWDERLIAALPELERLESRREAIAAKREERAELEAERLMLEETERSLLARGPASWGAGGSPAFEDLPAERELIRRFRRELEEAGRASDASLAELARLDRQKELRLAEEASRSEEQPDEESGDGALVRPNGPPVFTFVPRTKPALLQAWHRVDDARRDYERVLAGLGRAPQVAGSRAERNKGRSFSAGTYAWLGLAFALALAGMIAIWRGYPFASYILFGFAALGGGAAAYGAGLLGREAAGRTAEGTTHSAADGFQEARIRQAELNGRIRELLNDPEAAAGLVQEGSLPADFADAAALRMTDGVPWERLREAVYAQMERMERRERNKTRDEERNERIRQAEMEREFIAREAEARLKLQAELDGRWRGWLASRKLPAHLTPEDAQELLGLADQLAAARRQRRKVEARLASLDAAVRGFEQDAARLADPFGLPLGAADAGAAVAWLHREAVNGTEARKEAERLEPRIRTAEAAVREAERALAELAAKIAERLRAAGAPDEADLERRLRIDERRSALRKEAREIRLRLESGRDASAQAELYRLLSFNDEAMLGALLGESRVALAEHEAKRAELLERRGRLAQELDRLRADSELEDARLRRAELQSRLDELAGRYAVLAVADKLIARAKAVYEEEKQPEVLRRASEYFHAMTEDAYARIVAPGDVKALFAEKRDGALVDSVFLSRGTQEQMYLAMRFALCDAAAPDHPLPLLLDDLFVHFDERRLARTLPVLRRLAETRQLIVFTCHRHIATTISSGIAGARLVELGERAG
ncbi:AAA family ATPase [Paenibacillaceae bacterium WGS1546]|uniref:AAA family ATPase n=1 Tax=Cohnella sp. WGS1546 TaxID=3366810 RepID=UPI00372D413A